MEIDGSVTATGGGSQPATTTTTLGSSPNPSTVGQSVTFTATVQTNSPTGTATAATGNVVFKDNGTTVYTGSIANGVATYTTSGLSVGTHSFTAVYSGDSNYGTSTSAATNQTVNGNATTTSLGSSPNPSTFGQSVTFTATLQTNGATATAATGNVIFKDGGTAVYTNSSIASGVATYTTSGLTAGTHSFTAVYSGDSNYATSTSTATNQTVNGAVSSGPAPITYSGLEGLTGGGINGQNDNPTQWFAAWSVQNGDNSNYTVQNTTPLTFGSLVTSSDGKYLNGGGGYLSMGRRLPTGYQSIWDANGSVSDPFTAGEIDRGTVWVSFLLRVDHPLGDPLKIGFNSSPTPYQFSGSTGLQIATVNGNSSWGVRLGDNGTASTLGSVTVGSTVFVVIKFELSTTAGANNAYVWMFSNSSAANLGGADLNTGTAMASLTGKDTTDLRFKAIGFYLDNTANRVDVDEIRFGTSYASVSPVPAATTTATTTTLGSSPNPSTYGQPVTFTATVQTNGQTATDATGNVVFKDGGTPVSTNSAPVNGVFTYTTSGLTANTHAFTAVYSGDSKYATSTSTATNQVVNKATPTVTLAVNNSPQTYTGSAQSATVAISLSSVPGSVANIQLDAGANSKTAAGTYAATADFVPTDTANYNTLTGLSAGNFVIQKATPTVTVTPYSVTYDGNPQSATVASITGAGSETGVTVGSVTLNTTHAAAGSYPSDSWTFTGTANYNNIGSTTISNNIGKASSSVTVNGTTSFTYNGSAQGPAFTESGSGASLTYAYSGTANDSSSYSGTTAPTAAGSYSVTASVAADSNYNGASSSATAFTIAKTPTTTVVTVGSGSFTYTGSAITPATVSVTGAGGLNLTPTASYANNVNAGTATASYDYAGDFNYLSSSDSKDFTITPAGTGWSYDATGFTYNGSAQGPAVTGYAGSTAGLSASYAGASFDGTLYAGVSAPTNAGTYYVTNAVLSDGNYAGKTNYTQFTIAQATNAIALSADAAPSAYGDLVTFTAAVQTNSVTAADATSNLVFVVDGTPLATNALAAGTANYATAALTAGGHTVEVDYTGDNNYVASTNTLSQTVNQSTPAFGGLNGTPTITYGDNSITLSGTVSATTAQSTTVYPPAGATVTVTINGNAQTTTINDATGDFSFSYTTTGFDAGYNGFTVEYNYAGDANFASADDTGTSLTVNLANPTLTVTSPNYSITAGSGPVTVAGTVSASGPVYPSSEDVTVTIGTATATATLDGSGNFSASVDTTGLTAGPYTIDVAYAGDGINFNPATDDTSTSLTVTAPSSHPPTLTRDPLLLTNSVGKTLHIAKSYVSNNVTAYSGQTITSITYGSPSHGILVDAGSFVNYSQSGNGATADSFTYTAYQSDGASVTGTVNVRFYDSVLQGTPVTGTQATSGAYNGQFGVTFNGAVGKTYHLYRSIDPYATWIDVGSTNVNHIPQTIWDSTPPGGSAMYRVGLP